MCDQFWFWAFFALMVQITVPYCLQYNIIQYGIVKCTIYRFHNISLIDILTPEFTTNSSTAWNIWSGPTIKNGEVWWSGMCTCVVQSATNPLLLTRIPYSANFLLSDFSLKWYPWSPYLAFCVGRSLKFHLNNVFVAYFSSIYLG